jgi:hypothetical protein
MIIARFLILLVIVSLVLLSCGDEETPPGPEPEPQDTLWTVIASGTSQNLRGIAWSGNLFVIVGDSGAVLTSPEGEYWKVRSTGLAANLYDVAWSGVESLFVAVGGGYVPFIPISADGQVLAPKVSPNSVLSQQDLLFGVCYCESDSQFIAVGLEGLIFASSDGISWALAESGTDGGLYAVTCSDDVAVAVGAGIISSPDGFDWTVRQGGGVGAMLYDVVWSGLRFVTVGAMLTNPPTGILFLSTNGIDWSQWDLDGEVSNAVAWADTAFYAGGSTTVYSRTGTVWTKLGSGHPQIHDIIWAGDKLIAVGENGSILVFSQPGDLSFKQP